LRPVFTDLIKKYPGQISIAALSNEEESVVQKYLTETYATETPLLSYGLIDKDTSKPGSFENTPYFPYVYILKKGVVIWKGVAGYPKGETERLVADIVSGKWDEKQARETAKKAKVLDDSIEKLRDERRQYRKVAIGVEESILKQFEQKVAMNRNLYLPVRQEIQTLEYLLWFYGDSDRTKKEYDRTLALYRTVYQQAIENLSSSRDEMSFLAIGLLLADDTRFHIPELGIPVAEKAFTLPDEGIYNYLTLMAYAEAKAEQGKISEAILAAKESIEKAKASGVTGYDLDWFEKRLATYEKRNTNECSSFFSCLRSAFKHL